MRLEHPPYWFWRLDRWKLLIAALLALLALLLGLRGCGAPRAVVPTLSAPAAGAALVEGALGDVTGTAAPGAVVRFFDGSTLLGETTADASGAFRFTLPGLLPGAHTLTAATFDQSGVRLASSPALAFSVTAPAQGQAVAPTLSFSDSQAALLTGKPFVANGAAAPAAKIQLFDGDTLLGETTADSNGKWTLGAPALTTGAHTLVARAIGVDGVSAESAPVTVTVTPVAPAIAAPVGGLALTAGAPGAALTGTAAPGAKVQIFDGEALLGEAVAGPDGKWQFSLPALAAGPHNLVPRVTNPDGTISAGEPLSVEVAAAPVVAPVIDAPAGGLALTADTPGGALSGTAAPGARVQIFDGEALLGEAVAGPDGKWQFSLPALAAGPHNLVPRVANPDGTISAGEPLSVEVAPGAVAIAPSINAPTGGLALIADTPETLTGTAAPGAKVQIFDGEALLGEAVAGPDGKWQFSLPALSAGPHNLAARVTNPDGTISAGEPLAVTVGPADYPVPYRVTLGPNESVNVPVAGFCLNYGLSFPGASLQAVDALPDVVRKALAYAIKKGYADSDPWQTNLAVWALVQGTRLPGRDYAVADEIIRFAQSDAPAPELGLKLQSLYTALTSGAVEATLGDYASQQPGRSAYSGKGNLTLRNLTAQTQELLIPWGTRFRDASQSGVQDMAILPLR